MPRYAAAAGIPDIPACENRYLLCCICSKSCCCCIRVERLLAADTAADGCDVTAPVAALDDVILPFTLLLLPPVYNWKQAILWWTYNFTICEFCIIMVKDYTKRLYPWNSHDNLIKMSVNRPGQTSCQDTNTALHHLLFDCGTTIERNKGTDT